jgi:hypothetical protein
VTEDQPQAEADGGNVVNLSKTRAKRLMNAQNTQIRQRLRELDNDKAELQALKKHLANACAILEAVVRRHGPQVFDRQAVEQDCGSGRVTLDITDKRITLRLKDGVE